MSFLPRPCVQITQTINDGAEDYLVTANAEFFDVDASITLSWTAAGFADLDLRAIVEDREEGRRKNELGVLRGFLKSTFISTFVSVRTFVEQTCRQVRQVSAWQRYENCFFIYIIFISAFLIPSNDIF